MAPPVQLPTRKLGKSGTLVTAPGYGLMSLGGGMEGGDFDDGELRVLDRAWELGAVTWDTADKYGQCEDLVGRWFKLHPERRADVFLATKFGIKASRPTPESAPVLGTDSSPEYCRQSCENSLRRLGVDYIDLYYIHRTDGKTPVEKTMAVLAELKKEGKIKHIGIAGPSSSTLRRACAVAHVDAVQVEYNPWTLDIENESGTHLLKTCRELGVAVFCYSPLSKGFLTGQLRSYDDLDPKDLRRHMPRFSPENFPKNLVLVDKLKELAAKKGCTPGQLTIAWLMAQGEDIIPLPGTKTIKYLEENTGAGNVKLSAAEAAEIRAWIDESAVSGDQIPVWSPVRNYTDTDTPAL